MDERKKERQEGQELDLSVTRTQNTVAVVVPAMERDGKKVGLPVSRGSHPNTTQATDL